MMGTATIGVKGTKISISPLIRSNARRCAPLSHQGRTDVGARTSVPRFLHPVAPRVGRSATQIQNLSLSPESGSHTTS
jgi:hypothetical protein